MARQNKEEQDRKEQREVALINLKGKLPALYFSYLTQTEERPFGQNGLSLGHNLFVKYLNDEDIKNHVTASLLASEVESIKGGAGAYSGQISSKGLIKNGYEIINESIDSVYVSDIADVLGIKCSKFKDKYMGDLNKKDASKEEKELYRAIMATYRNHLISTYMSEALSDNSAATKKSLEEILA